MNLASDLSSQLIAALWRASFQGGLFVLVVWGVCAVAPSIPARFRTWLWRLAAAKFLVALVWSNPIELPLLPPTPHAVRPESAINAGVGIAGDAKSVENSVAELRPELPWQSIVAGAWCSIAVAGLLRVGLSWRAARRLRSECRPTNHPQLIAEASAAGREFGIRRAPQVLEIEGEGSPWLLGILRPAIVFPTATLARLDAAERTLVLGHELAHLRRGDLFWSLVAAVVRCLFFFVPPAWLCERRLRFLQETAADELVIELRRKAPADYAAVLLSVVAKLGSSRALPTLVAGVSGSSSTLTSRFLAMRFIRPTSRFAALFYGVVLTLTAFSTLTSWTLVAAESDLVKGNNKPQERPSAPPSSAAVNKAPSGKAAKSERVHRGRLVSFVGETLTVESNSLAKIATKIPASTKVLVWSDAASKYEATEGIESLKAAKAGSFVLVGIVGDDVVIRLGSRKGKTVGTFVSFNDGRLLMLGKNIGESYVKKYGNQLRYNKFRDDVPAVESIDGGAYTPVGTANKILPAIKEGTVLTVHGEGDDNITLVQIGVPKE